MAQSHGKCHCGDVEWTITWKDGKVPGHILCHCGACQKLGGGAYSCNQVVHKDTFKITKGSLNTYTYTGDSGGSVTCYFCPKCTAHPYHKQGDGDMLIARTVLLDNAKDMGVDLEIYGKNRLAFQPETAKTFSGMPE